MLSLNVPLARALPLVPSVRWRASSHPPALTDAPAVVEEFKTIRAAFKSRVRDLGGSTSKLHSFGGGRHNRYRKGATLEIPVSSILIIVLCLLYYYATRDYCMMENEISFSTFVEHVLREQLVERLEVINRSFVRVYLRPGADVSDILRKDRRIFDNPAPLTDLHADVLQQANIIDRLALRISESDLGVRLQELLAPHRMWRTAAVLSFEVGDLSQLESLIQQACPAHEASPHIQVFPTESGEYHVNARERKVTSIPPIFYRDEIDWIALSRSYIPSLILTALAFTTFTYSQTGSTPAVPPSLGHHMSQSTGSSVQDRILKFGKATPVLGKDVPKVTFADVAGLEQAKKEVSEFVEFLKQPRKFLELGAEIPKGALLVGPPGTGKTLLARAVAGEAHVPFYSMSGSDFIELFVGVGPSRIRDLFDRARKNAPAIVFIDEIDTIGRSRGAAGIPGNGGSDERESTLNALLVEMDGFTTSRSGVVILGGTNREDVLDPALTRPGRFDRRIALGKPTVRERKAIFDIHLRPVKVDPEHQREEISKRLAALTPGLSGAEIRSVCNEAAIIAARKDAPHVTLEHMEASVERLVGGLQKTGEVLTLKMKRHVALHEAGHAVCGWFLENADPVLKLSIVPRASGTLGYTQLLPDELLLVPKEELLTKICVLLGGRGAELLFADSITTGATDDLTKATRLAYSYVSHLGLDDTVGLISYPAMLNQWGQRPFSESVAETIDRRAKTVVHEQWERCLKLLRDKEKEVMAVAELLMDKETISFIDMRNLLGEPPGAIKESLRQFVEALPRRNSSSEVVSEGDASPNETANRQAK